LGEIVNTRVFTGPGQNDDRPTDHCRGDVTVSDRQALNKALLLMPQRERAELLKEALAAALAGLPDHDAQPIRAMTRQLSAQIPKLGELTALEVLAVIGAVWNENGARL
jgi:hypothetical protein